MHAVQLPHFPPEGSCATSGQGRATSTPTPPETVAANRSVSGMNIGPPGVNSTAYFGTNRCEVARAPCMRSTRHPDDRRPFPHALQPSVVGLVRYDAVIHLRTPTVELGYNHQNPLRTESAARAREVDALILQAWDGHPRRWLIESSADFLDKAGAGTGCLTRRAAGALSWP